MLVILDLLLLVLATARATRLVILDDLGQWFVQLPTQRLLNSGAPQWVKNAAGGLDCGFCVGFWIGVAALGTLAVAGGPGTADDWWRYAAGAFALNYVVGHLFIRLD